MKDGFHTPCANCAPLIDSPSSAEPHADLSRYDRPMHFFSTSGNGSMERYRCSECRLVLLRTVIDGLPSAKWERAGEQK